MEPSAVDDSRAIAFCPVSGGAQVEFIFPDTSLLMNFAAVNRVDLVSAIVEGRGSWTEAIRDEVQRWSLETKYQPLTQVFGFMPEEPHVARAEEMMTGEGIRRRLAKPGDPRSQHWGECETLAVIQHRYAGKTVLVLSEDGGVLTECRRLGVDTVTTRLLLEAVATRGVITWPEADGIAQLLKDMGEPVLNYPPPIRPPMPAGLRPQPVCVGEVDTELSNSHA
ncbi:hypothetical protein J2X42_004122 [Arthrobacter sp. BE255]|nr:hypothetical protein [Arthrobacter sp. BE255]